MKELATIQNLMKRPHKQNSAKTKNMFVMFGI